MHTITGSLAFCGALTFCGLISAQEAETERLIDSIQGPALYSAYCGVCHGKAAGGDGPMAKALKTAPPDLTRLHARNGGRFPAERVQRIISSREQIPGGHGTREMPVWGPIFSQIAWDQDLGQLRIYNLTKYLEKIQAK